jgi:glyoxylase-like metal-dependent hydrolase (beta-lactamase superfamily II)
VTLRLRSVLTPLAVAAAAVSLHAQQPAAGARPTAARQPQAATAPAAELRVIPIRGNVFMVAGAGANITVSVGKDGVLVVDTGSASMADRVLATVAMLDQQVTSTGMPQRSCVGVVHGCTWWNSSSFLPTTVAPPPPRPIAGVINTSADPEHIGGNEKLAGAGRTFGVRNLSGPAALGAWIVAHENVATRLSPGGNPIVPASALPNEVYFGSDKKLNFFNGEGVVIEHVDAAHSDGDSMVYFRGSDVIAAGDVFNMSYYPVIDAAHGGSINGLVKAANKLLDMIVWEHMMEGGTMVVPGHGRLADVADVSYYRDMVTILRDRINAMKTKGMTLAQIKAAHPSKDYDPRFGTNPKWTPDMFIEAIYETLGKGAEQ